MAAGCSTSWSHTKQTRFIRCPFGSAGGKWAELVGGGRACGNLFDHAKHLFDHAKRSGNGLRGRDGNSRSAGGVTPGPDGSASAHFAKRVVAPERLDTVTGFRELQ